MAIACALSACAQKPRAEKLAGIEIALPDWPEQSRHDDAGNGDLAVADGRGSRVALAWDVDPRPRLTPVAARAAAGLGPAEETPARITGHDALLLRHGGGATLVWRCDVTRRLFRLGVAGPRAPEIANLAAHTRCHAEPIFANGDVPAAATSALGPTWTFANRGRGSSAGTRGDEVLTFFAGQTVPPPRDAQAAEEQAAGWIGAAGLSHPAPEAAEAADGPQAHSALRVRGTAQLDGHPVRWTLLFWNCVPRQRTFTAVVFSAGAPDESALLAARCRADSRPKWAI